MASWKFLLPLAAATVLSAATVPPEQATACCSRTNPVAAGGRKIVRSSMVWPAAPEQPRIAYTGAVSSEADVGKRESGLVRFRQALSGSRAAYVSVQRPHDVYGDDAGRVYVSDGTRRSVIVFDPVTRSARTVGEAGQGRLVKPMGLGGDGALVYVADQGARRVVAFDAAGRFVAAYGGDHVLLNPVDVAVDPTGELVWVVDAYLHQVIAFDRATGRLVRRIGRHKGDLEAKKRELAGQPPSVHGAPARAVAAAESMTVARMGHAQNLSTKPRDLTENRGLEPGEFRYPGFVAVGPDGSVWVSDAMNFRVQGFTRQGAFIVELGGLGDRPGRFARPKGVAVDNEGHVYVADAAFNNVQVFDRAGRLLLAFSEIGSKAGELWMPLGLHIDGRDRILVADRYNDRVQLFDYLPENATLITASATKPAR